AAMNDIIFGAVALFEIAELQAVAYLFGAPIAPAQADRLGRDGVKLVGEFDGLKELDGVGADVDAGAELGEFSRLLVDLHLEPLPAQRDSGCQSAKARSDDGYATCVRHRARSDGPSAGPSGSGRDFQNWRIAPDPAGSRC